MLQKNFSENYTTETPPCARTQPYTGLFCLQTPAVVAHTTFR